MHKSSYYKIFCSTDGDYVINVYSSEDAKYIETNILDSGDCTWKVKDVIEFML